MPFFAPFREKLPVASIALLLVTVSAVAQPQRGVFGARSGASAQMRVQGHPAPKSQQPKQEHLSQWMDRHSNLPLADQQKALQNEAGFKDLPPETQQRLMNSLSKLNNMPPEQRRRMLARTEAMEKLTPQQRQQVRDAATQINSLPSDRHMLMGRAFRDLREMPEPQRQAILNSDRFKSQFTDQERGALSTLLSVEPYVPVQKPNDGSQQGK
jgi:hypothetical protein